MITEHALLPVIAGREEEFEAAFRLARPIVASMPGCRSVSLSRSVESPIGPRADLLVPNVLCCGTHPHLWHEGLTRGAKGDPRPLVRADSQVPWASRHSEAS